MGISLEEKIELTLLYVDDDLATRDMVNTMISWRFPKVTLLLAENGQSGLELFIARHPDIVVTDIQMPGMDGIQMAKEIKALDSDSKIIILTVTRDTESIIDTIDIGIKHYMLKPIKMKKLVSVIERCIDEILLERQLRQRDEYIRNMAYYDALTGLPNRQLFNELLHLALAQAHRHKLNRHLAVLFLDLNRFKLINDTHGHAVGDQLLKAISLRLKECCRRDGDTVARLGGDEFIILLPELDTAQEAVRLAQKITGVFTLPFLVTEHELLIGASIGISIFPGDGIDADTLIRKADIAMYGAKKHKSIGYQLFNPVIDEQPSKQMAM